MAENNNMDMRWALFGVALGFLLAGSILSEPPSPLHPSATSSPVGSRETPKSHEPFWRKAADDPTALFTFWLALFTAGLALSTVGLWIATLRAARISERTLTDHERPWLFLEGAKVSMAPDFNPSSANTYNGWFIELTWKNVGKMPALIEQCLFKIVRKDQLPPTPDYTGAGQLTCQRTVAPGDVCTTNPVGPGFRSSDQLVFFGKITYKELTGRPHTTGFAVEVAPYMPAFVPHASDAYDYYN